MPTLDDDLANALLGYTPPFKVDDGISGWVVDAEGTHCLDIRGWGHLTGFLGMPESTASLVQDAFARSVAEALNQYFQP